MATDQIHFLFASHHAQEDHRATCKQTRGFGIPIRKGLKIPRAPFVVSMSCNLHGYRQHFGAFESFSVTTVKNIYTRRRWMCLWGLITLWNKRRHGDGTCLWGCLKENVIRVWIRSIPADLLLEEGWKKSLENVDLRNIIYSYIL